MKKMALFFSIILFVFLFAGCAATDEPIAGLASLVDVADTITEDIIDNTANSDESGDTIADDTIDNAAYSNEFGDTITEDTIATPAYYIEADDTIDAAPAYAEIGGSIVEIGDIVEFGGIDWILLDIQDGAALLLSRYILSQRTWHYEQQLLTWDRSDMRRYLNEEFIANTFTEEEQTLILETHLETNMNLWYRTAGAAHDSVDRVFLLSIEEMLQYFGDSGMYHEKAGMPIPFLSGFFLSDEYNHARIARPIEGETVVWWWLRTSGHAVNPRYDSAAVVVNGAGEIVPYGLYLIMEGGVRPALWLKI